MPLSGETCKKKTDWWRIKDSYVKIPLLKDINNNYSTSQTIYNTKRKPNTDIQSRHGTNPQINFAPSFQPLSLLTFFMVVLVLVHADFNNTFFSRVQVDYLFFEALRRDFTFWCTMWVQNPYHFCWIRICMDQVPQFKSMLSFWHTSKNTLKVLQQTQLLLGNVWKPLIPAAYVEGLKFKILA